MADFWVSLASAGEHDYDHGGWLPTVALVVNDTGKPERVLNPEDCAKLTTEAEP